MPVRLTCACAAANDARIAPIARLLNPSFFIFLSIRPTGHLPAKLIESQPISCLKPELSKNPDEMPGETTMNSEAGIGLQSPSRKQRTAATAHGSSFQRSPATPFLV